MRPKRAQAVGTSWRCHRAPPATETRPLGIDVPAARTGGREVWSESRDNLPLTRSEYD